MLFLSTLIPFVMAFLAFRGEGLVPAVYQNLGFSSLFVVVILMDIARKKTLQEEIAQIKNILGEILAHKLVIKRSFNLNFFG